MDDQQRLVRELCRAVDRHAAKAGWGNTELILQRLAQDAREMARRNEEGPADIDVRNIQPECLQPEVDDGA